MMTDKNKVATAVLMLSMIMWAQAFSQQSGVVSFSYWQTGHAFETGSGARNDYRWVAFSPPFTSTPKVVVSLKTLDADKNINLRIDTNANYVSKYGFWLYVNTWADTKIYAVATSWVAYTS